MVDVQGRSSWNALNSREHAEIRESLRYTPQLLSTEQEALPTIYFLHLLQIAGHEANMARSSLSDETFKLLVHRYLTYSTKRTPQTAGCKLGEDFSCSFSCDKLGWGTRTSAVNQEASPGNHALCHSQEDLGVCLACPAPSLHGPWHQSDAHGTIYISSISPLQVNKAEQLQGCSEGSSIHSFGFTWHWSALFLCLGALPLTKNPAPLPWSSSHSPARLVL